MAKDKSSEVVVEEDGAVEEVVAAPGGEEPVVYAGTWVRLGFTENVPEEVRGHIAHITFAPIRYCQEGECEMSPRAHEHQAEGQFTVHTRDQFGMTLTLDKADFAVMSSAGRHEIMNHA